MSYTNPGPATGNNVVNTIPLSTPLNPSQDQIQVSTDSSVFREGCAAINQTGQLFTLIGDLTMKYWSHNVAIDGNGNFLGRDDPGPCSLIAITEGLGSLASSLTMFSTAAGTTNSPPGTWTRQYTIDLTTGIISYSTQNALTAKAGGGQGGGPTIQSSIVRVTTVATAADSITLPASTAGMQMTVINAAAANSMNVFPATGDAINAGAANAAIAVAAGKTMIFFCAVAGTWNTVLTA